MMAPVVVLPVSRMDWHLAIKWIRWVKRLSLRREAPGWRFQLVALCSPALSTGERLRLEEAGGDGELDFQGVVVDSVKEVGYFGTPNQMILAALELGETHFPGHPILWLEADTVPISADWYDRIAQEYSECGKPFLGDHVLDSPRPHMTGNAVYPPNWRELAPSLLKLDETPRWGWDSQCAHETLPKSARSTTIRQVWRPPAFTKENWKTIVPEGTAVFHQDKTGTLIDVLCEEVGIPPIPLDQQIEESTYDMERHLPSGEPGERLSTPMAAGAMAVLWVTFRRDLEFLKYSIASYHKYAKGFLEGVVVVPSDDLDIFDWVKHERGIRLLVMSEPPGKGNLAQCLWKCRADELCPQASAILHMDADVVFWAPCTPEDFAPGGRPRLILESYEAARHQNPNRGGWQRAVENAVGFKPYYEGMTCHPNCHLRQTYGMVRMAVERHTGKKFTDYVFSCENGWNPMPGFTEFPLLAAIAMRDMRSYYTPVNYDRAADALACRMEPTQFQYVYRRGRDKVAEVWSHASIKRYEADLANWSRGQIPEYWAK